MTGEIERRLAAAAEALREFEVTGLRCAALRDRIAGVDAQLADLRAAYADEQKDVDRLEGLSFTRVLASLRGSREDALARERAQAEAARYRVAEAQARLDALARELEAAQARREQLAGAPREYGAALADKERHLTASGDPRGPQLLRLADERGRLTGELKEIEEAVQAAEVADDALWRVQERLGSARSWSTYDTFFGGGPIASAVKHSRLDEAAEAAAHADRCLAVLRTELADVGGVPMTAPGLAVDGRTRFFDVWLDNIFTDLRVRDHIRQAAERVSGSRRAVREIHARLKARATGARARLAEIEAEREQLLR